MNTSILIIAHDEEENIEKCIKSLLSQTKKPSEIVLIAHNCTDRTENIVKKYNEQIKLVSYKGPKGPLYARHKGFETVEGDVVACIDADSVAKEDWFEKITKPLSNSRVSAVGGYVIFKKSLLGKFMSYEFFYITPKIKPEYRFYFWGANFACRKSDYEKCGGLLPLVKIRKDLDLKYYSDDLYLSLSIEEFGSVEFAPMAKVITQPSHDGVISWAKRLIDQTGDYYKLLNYFDKELI